MIYLSGKNRRKVTFAIFIVPTLAIAALWVVYPLCYSLWSSFYELNPLSSSPPRFVGLSNYIDMIMSPVIRQSFEVTVLYVAVTVIVQFILGFGLALLLHPFKAKSWITPMFIIPMMIPSVATGIIFKIMFDETNGIINYLFTYLGFSSVSWLGHPLIALFSVMIVEIWQNTPFVLLIMSAGLASLPTTPYEAAKVDGASRYAIFRYITIPLLKPLMLVVLLMRIMLNFRVFDTIYILTQGGPGRNTQVLGYLAYTTAFKFLHMGSSAALSYLMVAFMSIICIFYMRITLKQGLI